MDARQKAQNEATSLEVSRQLREAAERIRELEAEVLRWRDAACGNEPCKSGMTGVGCPDDPCRDCIHWLRAELKAKALADVAAKARADALEKDRNTWASKAEGYRDAIFRAPCADLATFERSSCRYMEQGYCDLCNCWKRTALAPEKADDD